MTQESPSSENTSEQSPEVVARLEAFATHAQAIKEAILNVDNVTKIMQAVYRTAESAPHVNLYGHDKIMVSLSENGDPSARMVELGEMQRSLNELREKEESAAANETENAYADVDLADYADEIPQYILDIIANLPRFHQPQ